MRKRRRNAIIVGAGADALAAAFRLLKNSDVRPIILERENFVGGRNFFATEDELSTWREIFPDITAEPVPTKIFCRGKFFDCPIAADWSTFSRFGFFAAVAMSASRFWAKIFPRDELTNEDRLINRFGRKFFETMFAGKVVQNFGDADKIFFVDDVRRIRQNFSDAIKNLGGEVLTAADVKNFRVDGDKIRAAQVSSPAGMLTFPADYFLAAAKNFPVVEIVAEKILVDAPCRVYVNDSNFGVARAEIFGNKIRAEFPADFTDADFSARAAEELVAMGVVEGVVESAEKIFELEIPDGLKNFFALDDSATVQTIAEEAAQ